MSAAAVPRRNTEQEFFDTQMLPPEKRGISFEVLFYRQLQQVSTRIHDTENVDQIMLEASQDICKLLNADRLTLYAVNEDGSAIVSKVKTGLNTSRELKLPINAQSLAGYAASSRQLLNVADVYDEAALARIHPALNFLKEVDRRSGYRTRQMLVVPILDGSQLHGVLQVINNKSDQPFGELEVEGATQLCKTLATAIRQRARKAERRATRYDGLVSEGVLTAGELQHCIARAREEDAPVEHILMADLGIRPAQIGPSLAKFFGVPYEAFNPGRIRSEMLQGPLKREFVQAQGWVPLEDSADGLIVMCTDPEAVRGSRIAPQVLPGFSKFAYRVTTQTEFEETVAQLYGSDEASIDELLADLSGPIDPESEESGLDDSAAADNELVKFVNKVIVDAHQQKASDIHIEPLPGKAKTGIRFRIDGSLQPYIEVPAQFRQALVTRLKIMCDLDISERRKPQDGKIKFRKFGPLDIELRVATIPSAGGVEDVVMRILSGGEPIPMEQLGLAPHNRQRVEQTVSKPHGLFYVCGPTGSGKTTTLHSILKFLNRPDTKIWTAEDPVEITQKGLRQVQINRKAGIDFATVMRAFLRADPDVIMVGESRDRETVSMGVEASLTGHLVFSTLHTNSAPESIVRLLDMGMDPFNFADALLGILAQRLARKLCDCKQAYTPDAEEIKLFVAEYADELRHAPDWKADYGAQARALYEGWVQQWGQEGRLTFYRSGACAKCNGTGYKGRVGLHELLVADDRIRRLIQERARVADLFAAAVETGMHTLKMDGMEKVMQGLTDLRQVRSVCSR
ncbi:MAG: Flp pilus assembly complex ATPase component TadA [Ramlibacter sp.]|nr:Flp pilus assembly complex ATPase component TadA [Ramlibacter sp.]